MTDPDRKVWGDVLALLRRQHPSLYRKWFEEELEPLPVVAGALPVRTRTAVHCEYLAQNCVEQFTDALRAITGTLTTIRFLKPGERMPEAPPVVAATPAPTAERRPANDETLAVNPDFEFESFVVGPTNRLAHAAAMAVAKNPGTAYNPLFIHGDVGLGKTHLLQAICLEIRAREPDCRVCYLSCEGFVSQFMEAVQSGRMSDFKHRFREVDVLVIDDIQTLGSRDRSQEEFFHTFNSLYQGQKQIVLSSDAPPDQIPDLEKRLVSRFKWGLVTQIDPPCFETRVAIIKSKAGLRGLDLPDNVAEHVAAAIDSNIRELEGAVVTLQIRSDVEGRPIDMALAREAIGRAPSRETPRHASIQTIIDAVTDFYDVRLSDLQSKRRSRSVTIPRQVCMFLARRNTRHSLEEIGGYFGGRDHTTVMHAVKAIESKCLQDPEFDADVRSIEDRFRPPGRDAQ